MTLGRLTTLLAEKGIEVSVIAPKRAERMPTSDRSISLFPVPGFPLPKYPELRFGWPAFQNLRREWTRRPPTLVHVATEGPLGWSAAIVARQLDIPLVSSFHTNFHSYSRHYGLGLLQTAALAWLRTFHNKTLRTFVPSHDLMHTLQEKGFHHLRLLARGVDTNAFDPAHRSESLRAEWGATPDTPVILYTGRLAEEKNLPLVVKAYLRIQTKLPNARMVFVGDGPMLGKLRELLPMAVFAGMKTGSALAASYASADLFLFASTTETFGNVVTEAMASALPVLAFDYAAPGRFIQSHLNGLLAPFGDETAFLDKADWLAHYPTKWNSMGLAARSTVLPLSWNTIADSYLNEIRTLALN
jgi:glycosyltransferase involved in cell wall biosynthesis